MYKWKSAFHQQTVEIKNNSHSNRQEFFILYMLYFCVNINVLCEIIVTLIVSIVLISSRVLCFKF